MKNFFFFAIYLLMSCVAISCGADESTIKIDGFDTILHCQLEDCSEWKDDIVKGGLLDYREHWEALFPQDKFQEPKSIYIEAEEACSLLPETDWTQPDCGGWANGEDIHVQGMLESFLLQLHMSSFDHELTHNALRHNTGDGDPNHSLPGGPWTTDHDLLVHVMQEKGCGGWAEFGTPCP